ncbi:MAG TPA: hypothetical protein VK892_12080, partial [Pyrinomonadaceae bacterium]|nr:hypothetical protein [Pyrinomonadaceae bacterium]
SSAGLVTSFAIKSFYIPFLKSSCLNFYEAPPRLSEFERPAGGAADMRCVWENTLLRIKLKFTRRSVSSQDNAP